MAKDKDYIKLIHDTQWLRLRKRVLTATPLCAMCTAAGRVEAATEVHHICPVEDAVTYAEKRRRMYDPGNVVALCHACHVEVHTQMGRSGKAATKKRNEAQVSATIAKFFGDEPDPGG